MVGEARPFLDQMSPETVYVVTWTTEKTKRSVTGRFVSHDDETLILMDEKGRFRNAPIDKIIRINYYEEGRAPF